MAFGEGTQNANANQQTNPSPNPVASPTASAPAPSAASSAPAATAKTCREVQLGPVALDGDMVKSLSGIGSDVSVTALSKRTLMLCGSPANIDVVKHAFQHLSGIKPDDRSFETHYVRLFFFRRAADLATAINNSGGLTTPVKPLGDDLLVFTSESDSDNEAIVKLKRWVAMIDVPRPEVSLLAWSAQISSNDPLTVRDKSNYIRSVVSHFNEQLQQALGRGGEYLEKQRQDDEHFFAPILREYLTKRYYSKAGAGQTSPCEAGKYCLGFTQLLAPVQPSLSRMLITLIASSRKGIADSFIEALEDRGKEASLTYVNDTQGLSAKAQTRIAAAVPLGSCEARDLIRIENVPDKPVFSCLAEQLQESIGNPNQLAQTRVALADFLYQYKSAQFYPEDFTVWNQAASAQALDSRLNPIIVAFNRDLALYLRTLQNKVEDRLKADKKIAFASDGIITARAVSGNTVKVDTTTQSFFDQPPTLSARDLFNSLSANTAIAPIIAGNPGDLLAAAIKAEQRTTAKIGRDFNLQITANTLQGASACEMDVTLNSGEGDKPSLLNTTSKTSSDENLSRVAKHNISTKVRVDSQKVFEISSFQAALVHGKSVPLLPPFIDLPYIGNLARLRLPPGTVYHQSFAIVSAVIVPTAADLANTIEFRAGLEPGSLAKVSLLDKAEVAAKPQTLYYWIATHYANGDSLSGPFPVTGVKSVDKDHTVTLEWSRPVGAQSFDILRTTKGDKLELEKPSVVALRIKDPKIKDDKPDKDLNKYYVPDLGKEASKLKRVTLTKEPVITNPPPDQAKTETLYYWIVTHFNGGESISGPFDVPDAPVSFDEKHTVTLAWRAPEKAKSFDILRSETRNPDLKDAHVLVDSNIEEPFFIDRRPSAELQVFGGLPVTVYRRIVRMGSNLNAFHKLELDCIFNETLHEDYKCELKLSTTASDGQ
jgi:hypothetical protein